MRWICAWGGSLPRSGVLSAWAVACASAAESVTAPRLTKAAPSANPACADRAASMASRVLPTPPGPTNASSRQSSLASRPAMSASSAVRPTKGVTGLGRVTLAGSVTSVAAPAATLSKVAGSVSTLRSPRAQARKAGRNAGGTCSAWASNTASSADGWRSSASIFLIMAVEQKTCSAMARWVKRRWVRRCLIHSPKE